MRFVDNIFIMLIIFIILPISQVVSGELDIVKRLLEIPHEVITSMQATINDMVSHFVYQKPGSKLAIKDAFDYTIDHLLQKFGAHVTI